MRHRITLTMAALLVLLATGCWKTGDYDGDNRADLMVVDGGTSSWYRLGGASPQLVWTGPGAVPAGGDYDGDGNWEPAEASMSSFFTSGPAGTISFTAPCTRNTDAGQFVDTVPRDYDGDHRTDAAIYCEPTGTFFVAGHDPVAFGSPGTGHLDPDYPVPADYDGDGKADLATWNPRSGAWHVRASATGIDSTTTFNLAAGAFPTPGDYDGDGRAEPALLGWADNAIHILGAAEPIVLGARASNATPLPTVADYDGDGKDDASYFELPGTLGSTGTWHIRSSSTGTEATYPLRSSASSAYEVPANVAIVDLVVHISFWTKIVQCRANPATPGC